MSQPVKLSDGLVLDARLIGRAAQRSIAGQIEFWARLGKAIEPLLQGKQSVALSTSGAEPLSKALKSVNSKQGKAQLADYLKTVPFPHYEPAPHAPGFLVRTESNGTRTVGRFVNREFKPAKNGRH